MKNLSRFYHEMIRENFVEELRENLNLSRMEFNEMSQLSLFIPTPVLKIKNSTELEICKKIYF